MDGLMDVVPGKKPLKDICLAVVLWFVGRAIQVSFDLDEAVRNEFDALPAGFTFSLGIMPDGPAMIVGKGPEGNARYFGDDQQGKRIDLRLIIKNLEAAILIFTCQESLAEAIGRNRLVLIGSLSHACSVVRIMEIMAAYLLPKRMARSAVKRYPLWPLGQRLNGGGKIFFRVLCRF